MGLPDVEEGEAVVLEHTDRRYGDARDGDGRPYTFDRSRFTDLNKRRYGDHNVH